MSRVTRPVRLLAIALVLIAAPAAAAATLRSNAAASVTNIRKVDFRNFAYVSGTGAAITVKNGVYANTIKPNEPVYFQVLDVDHGDLDGDGVEEAIVTTLENTGGTGQFTDGLIFRLVGGNPKQIGDLGIGDRADGGIHGITIVNGRIVVDRYGQNGSGACCPTYIERDTLKLDSNGETTSAAKTTKRAFISLSRSDAGAPSKITFLRGTASVTIEGDGMAGDRGTLDAGKGQTVTYSVSKVPNFPNARAAIITLSIGTTTVAVVSSGGSWTGKLPTSGRYTLAWKQNGPVSSKDSTSAYATVDLSIR